MKILQISTYMTSNEVPLLSQCKAGFGYMVYDIASSLSKKAVVESLLINYRYKEFKHGGIHFLPSTIGLFLKNVFKCCSPMIILRLCREYKMELRTIVRLLYVWLVSGYYYDVIKKGHFDIVHIHGCGFNEDILMAVCKKANVQYLITLHGLNSFSDSVNLEFAGKRYERDFLKRVINGEFPITVISSGIKRIIMDAYNVQECHNISVVTNAFSFSAPKGPQLNIRSRYHLPADSKLILYVGNLCHRKNQKQIIDAYDFVTPDVADKTYVLFLGREIEPEYQLREYLKKSKWEEHFVLCGNIDKSEIPYYYEQGNGVALLSISEGFGLSLIEGMHFGKPCMTFSDLDAFDDIYDPKCVVAVEERNDASVANGLRRLLSETWNETVIKKYSEKFVAERMAENYINLYKKIIG